MRRCFRSSISRGVFVVYTSGMWTRPRDWKSGGVFVGYTSGMGTRPCSWKSGRVFIGCTSGIWFFNMCEYDGDHTVLVDFCRICITNLMGFAFGPNNQPEPLVRYIKAKIVQITNTIRITKLLRRLASRRSIFRYKFCCALGSLSAPSFRNPLSCSPPCVLPVRSPSPFFFPFPLPPFFPSFSFLPPTPPFLP